MIKIILLLIFLAVDCSAFSIFDGLYKKVDNIKEQNNKTNAELGVIKGNQIKLESTIQTSIQAAIQAEMKAQTGIIAGFNNKLENLDSSIKVQGDMQQTTSSVNDTGLMMKIIIVLGGIITSLIAILSSVVMKLFATINYRDNLKTDLNKAKERGDKYKRHALEISGLKEVEKIL